MKRRFFTALLSTCFLASIISLASVEQAQAHHGSASAAFGPGAPVETTAPQTLPEGRFLIYERYEVAPYEKYDWAKAPEGSTEGGNVDSFTFFNTMLGYGINNSLSAYVILPYAIKEQDNKGTSEGFGDLSFMLQYGFKYGERDGIKGWYANGPEDTAGQMQTLDDWKFVVFGGFSIPNGTITNRDQHGEVFDLGMQPGFGVPTYNFGAAISKKLFYRTTFTADASMTTFSQSNDDKPGNETRANAALGYELFENPGGVVSRIDILGEANFVYLTPDQAGDRTKHDENLNGPDSGGTILYLSPAMRITFADRLSLGLMVKFPSWTDLNQSRDVNTGEESRQQGAEGLEDYRAIATISYSF